MRHDTINWILFDLGNVLVDHVPLGTGRISEFLGIETEVLHTFLLNIDASRKLCTGEFGAEEFTSIVNREFNGSITPAMITEWFGPEVDRVYPEIPGLIGSLADRYSLGVLSNTFFGHWDYFITTDLARQFDAVMASHLLGCVKPDPRIYREALKCIAASPAETLFIDDRKENVEAAQALGINSFQSKSPADTIQGLQQYVITTDN
ncbi:MAG: HAD family phosphatase [bacterium]